MHGRVRFFQIFHIFFISGIIKTGIVDVQIPFSIHYDAFFLFAAGWGKIGW
jgi:hypothetical protein